MDAQSLEILKSQHQSFVSNKTVFAKLLPSRFLLYEKKGKLCDTEVEKKFCELKKINFRNFVFQASKQPSSPPLSSRARSLPPTQEKAEKKAEKKWSKKGPQQQPSTDIDSSSESTSSSSTSMSRPRGRPAKRKSQNKILLNIETKTKK